jgi:DNA-binding response OmpR family regulator
MTQPLILLVDDIPDHARLYEAALRQNGYRVQLVHSGAAALAAAREHVPACVVIDVRLPDVSGWDLCRSLKAEAALKRVPVIMLTDEVTAESAGDGAKSGCTAWLAHPTVAHDVSRVVAHVLAQRRPSPASEKDAVVGISACRACGSGRIRATLRLGAIQYYACRACNLSWRVESDVIVA